MSHTEKQSEKIFSAHEKFLVALEGLEGWLTPIEFVS